jgi:chromosome segregation ATPase
LDTGESFTLRQENERLASQVAELTSRVEEARQEAERIRGNWQALSDLMAEMGRTEERQGA